MRSTLSKVVLIEKIFEELGLSKREGRSIVDQFFEEIVVSLENNEPVHLSGFGSFELSEKKKRIGRDPQTGKELPVCAQREVSFVPGEKLKARIDIARELIKTDSQRKQEARSK